MIQLLVYCMFLSVSYRELQWSDFKMKPPAEEVAKGWVAHTETKWVLWEIPDYDGNIRLSPEFSFVPEKSWTITNSEFTLAHENTHYNISLLWYRKFEKHLKKHPGSSYRQREKTIIIFNYYWQEQLKLQILFDKETDHSRNKSMELKWEEQILNGLK